MEAIPQPPGGGSADGFDFIVKKSRTFSLTSSSAIVRSMKRLLLFFLPLLILLAVAPDVSAQIPATELSATDKADIRRIEAYLNKLTTVQARFLQLSSNGAQAEGDLYISRPGRMRIQYDPPSPVFIVADGSWLIYVDKKLDQVSYVPLESTPAGLLLDKKISLLGGDFTITHFENAADVIRVTLYKTDDPGKGILTLVFSDRPLTLKKWTITDAQGILTSVSLIDSRFGIPLKASLFKFNSPFTETGESGN